VRPPADGACGRPRYNAANLTGVPSPNRSPRPPAAWWPARWRIRADGAATGLEQMARDLALLDRAAEHGEATLRTYHWVRETVSLGRNERVHAGWDVAAMQAAGLEVVRRPTGGRALLHGADLAYAVTLPLPRTVTWRAAYAAVNARLLAALHSLGVPATLVEGAPAVAPEGAACFAAPADGEIVLPGGKLVGSAVWRTPAAYLQHGSILLQDTQARLAAFRRPAGDVPPAGAGLAPDGNADAWRPRLHAALRDAFAAAPDTDAAAALEADLAPAVARHRARLGAPDWLWRR
jgi:lipoate-protein ligase A